MNSPGWRAIAPSWLRTCRRSARRLASRIFDGRRMTACRMSHCRWARGVSVLGAATVRSTRLRHRGIRGGSDDWQAVHLRVPFSVAPGTRPAQSSSGVAWINSEKNGFELKLSVIETRSPGKVAYNNGTNAWTHLFSAIGARVVSRRVEDVVWTIGTLQQCKFLRFTCTFDRARI